MFGVFNTLTCCTCCRMIIRGGGGGIMYNNINVLDEPEVLQPVVPRIIPTKFSRWPKSTTNKISLIRLIIFDVFWGVNPIEPSLLVLNKWMEHGNTSKNGDLCRCYTKKSTSVQKKIHLALQLDMASQCRLVAVCFCVSTSALALKRREEEKLDEWMSPWYDSDDWKS